MDDDLARLDAVTVEDARRMGLATLSAKPALGAIGPIKHLPSFDRIVERLGKSPAFAA